MKHAQLQSARWRTTLLSANLGWKYQIRTKRNGRGRLVTVQADEKNRIVLLEWYAAMAAVNMVNNVFNFFLSGLSETLDENHSVVYLVSKTI